MNKPLAAARSAPSIAVVGAGSIAQFHLRALEALGARVRAISDLNRAATEPLCARLGADYTADWQAVVARSDVEAVCILAPTPVHREVAAAALAAGKHVLCEKTLTLSGGASLALAQQAQAAKRVLFTSYMKRRFPAVERAREVIAGLGRVHTIHLRTHQPVPVDLIGGVPHEAFVPTADAASPVKRMAGGGVLTCGGSHILDLLLHLVGKPVEAYGRALTLPGRDIEYAYQGLLRFADDAVAHLDCAWHAHGLRGHGRDGWDESIEIHGSHGVVRIETPLWNRSHELPARLTWHEASGATHDVGFPAVDPFRLNQERFLASVRGDVAIDPFDGYRVDYLLEELYRSSASGTPIALSWKDA
jgi:predicted dehydrogenase